jgi:hypothetical protein
MDSPMIELRDFEIDSRIYSFIDLDDTFDSFIDYLIDSLIDYLTADLSMDSLIDSLTMDSLICDSFSNESFK